MSKVICQNCGSQNITPGKNQVVDDEGNVTEEEFECTDCRNVWTIKYRGMAERDILLSQTTRPLLFCAAHQLESFIKKGYRASESQAELEARRTPRALDNGDSAASQALSTPSADNGQLALF